MDYYSNMKDAKPNVNLGNGQQVCQAVYNIFTSVNNLQESNTIVIELKWKEASRLMELPPSDASACIKAAVNLGKF